MKAQYIFKTLSLIIPLLWIATSCTEKIDIELDDTYTRLVVEGGITDQQGPHVVKLSLSGSYYENSQPRWVEGADVVISDGSQEIILTEEEPGHYYTEEDVHGEIGKTYTLTVNGVEIDGETKEYTASCKLNAVPPIDSIKVEYNDRWEIWEAKLYALDPPSRELYLFNIYRNGELMSDTLDEIVVADDEFFNGNYTYGIMVQWLESWEAQIGDTIMIEMGSITEEYSNFILDVQMETGFSTPLFSGPPANIRSNISNGAVGFFYAYSLVRAETIIEE